MSAPRVRIGVGLTAAGCLALPDTKPHSSLEQTCFYAEVLFTCYIHAPQEHANRERYFAKGKALMDHAHNRWPGYLITMIYFLAPNGQDILDFGDEGPGRQNSYKLPVNIEYTPSFGITHSLPPVPLWIRSQPGVRASRLSFSPPEQRTRTFSTGRF